MPIIVSIRNELDCTESSSVFTLSGFHEHENDRPTCYSNTVVPTF